MKKLLIIPILIILYIFFIDVISQMDFSTPTASPAPTSSGGGTIIGVGESISVTVTRSYLFGLFTLPVYISGLGSIGIYHDMFFVFIFILTIALFVIEVKNRKEIKGRKIKRKRR